jgi:hypothetical protein
MPKLRALLLVFTLLLFVAPAYTQGTPAQTGRNVGSGAGSSTDFNTHVSEGGSGAAVGGLITSYVGGGLRSTKGQPFSADVVDETDHLLADGTHIHRESHGKMFRDSEGRTRNEAQLGFQVDGEWAVHITIFDPVQNQYILLDPRNKQATVHTLGVIASATSPAPVNPPPDRKATPQASTGTPIQSGTVVESLTVVRQAQVNTSTVRGPGAEHHEVLGTSQMEGFTVTGARFARTIPAGERGNDRPMTTTSESWFSRDLGVALLSKSENPEAGQHTHKLVNIRTGDPDPLLFQIPADYTVKEQPQR